MAKRKQWEIACDNCGANYSIRSVVKPDTCISCKRVTDAALIPEDDSKYNGICASDPFVQNELNRKVLL